MSGNFVGHKLGFLCMTIVRTLGSGPVPLQNGGKKYCCIEKMLANYFREGFFISGSFFIINVCARIRPIEDLRRANTSGSYIATNFDGNYTTGCHK